MTGTGQTDVRHAGATASTLHSAIYEGAVRHRRYRPRAHAFRYRMFMLYLDLAEIPDVFRGRWLWSVAGRNVGEFRRSDFHGDPTLPLDQAVRDTVQARLGRRPAGPIRMLAHLRYFGLIFNPVTFYYGFASDSETLEWILAEITNTPWKQRHAYVLPVAEAALRGSTRQWTFGKDFHVSPFMAMRHDYRWRFQTPGQALRVHMDVLQPGDAGTAAAEFDATLVLRRRPLDGAQLARSLLLYPLMTARVVLAIHWQALVLWLKRVPVHDHPMHGTPRPASVAPQAHDASPPVNGTSPSVHGLRTATASSAPLPSSTAALPVAPPAPAIRHSEDR